MALLAISALGNFKGRCDVTCPMSQAAEMCAEVPVEAGHADVVALVFAYPLVNSHITMENHHF